MLLAPVLALQVGLPPPSPTYFQNPRLRESSGIAVSRAYPRVLWTHNDSGDQPYLYATDVSGNDRGRIRVRGARAVDWEDLAVGPCPIQRTPHVATCVYIADTGDKRETRSGVRIYAVPEPFPPDRPGDTMRVTTTPSVLRLHYPDGPHDVEAMYVLPRDTALYLVTKGTRHGSAVRVYRVDRHQWTDGSAKARRVQTLDLRPDAATGRLITGAAIRQDARIVAIRTYAEIYLYEVEADGRLARMSGRPCDVAGLARGGEAVDFVDDSTLVLTSEASRGRPGTISLVRFSANARCAPAGHR
jgi:hypothetical protein